MTSYVYFIQRGEDGPIKIGRSSNVADRLKTLQTACSERLTVLCYREEVQGRTERDYHVALAHHRVMGEWFNPDPEVIKMAYDDGIVLSWINAISDATNHKPWRGCVVYACDVIADAPESLQDASGASAVYKQGFLKPGCEDHTVGLAVHLPHHWNAPSYSKIAKELRRLADAADIMALRRSDLVNGAGGVDQLLDPKEPL